MRAVGLTRWILRMASRACESAAAVTVQVFRTTTSAEKCSLAGVRPSASSARRMAEASASVARQPKFSMKKVGIDPDCWLKAGEIIAANRDGAGGAGLNVDAAALVAEEDQVGAAADAEFGEQVGDVEFHGTFGYVQ